MWLKRCSVARFYTSLHFLLAHASLLQKLQKRSTNRARSKRKTPKMISRQSLWRLKPTACPSCPSLGRLKLPACSSCLLSWRRPLFEFRGCCPTIIHRSPQGPPKSSPNCFGLNFSDQFQANFRVCLVGAGGIRRKPLKFRYLNIFILFTVIT